MSETKTKQNYSSITELLDAYNVPIENRTIFLDEDVNLSDREIKSLVSRSEKLIVKQKMIEMQDYKGHPHLNDFNFLLKLKDMGIPKDCLKYLENKDSLLSVEEIWARIRERESKK